MIDFEAQLREKVSRDEDSRGVRTLIDDSNGVGYIYERHSTRIVVRLKALKKRNA